MSKKKYITGYIIDIQARETYKRQIEITDGIITSIKHKDEVEDQFILPGFIDAHIHIESSMVTPMEFARVALTHGTIATVSDPHEIANVCGIEGVHYMIENARDAGLKLFFGAPSCVPATTFENSGAVIDANSVTELLASPDIWYLSEMMNYPGVLNEDELVISKINAAKLAGKPIDGHAPGLKGELARKYISQGISTDHECFTLEEALDKIKFGMKVIIREGSAAKNFDALHTLIASHPDMVMFCSDDKHPDDLILGHINLLVKKALALGYDLYDVLKIACINPIKHYNLPVGQLNVGDKADFIIINQSHDFSVTHTYIDGFPIYKDGVCHLKERQPEIINNFNAREITPNEIKTLHTNALIPVIKAIDGSLITEKTFVKLTSSNDGYLQADLQNDILKICVINRYDKNSKPAIGFIKNFELKECAIASTVAHDSHNIIAVGTDDSLLAESINLLVHSKGGLSAVTADRKIHLPLPIAGLMSDKSVNEIGKKYSEISNFVKNNGCKLSAPYMTLSFMALLVIPKIKISDLGMFDAESFTFY